MFSVEPISFAAADAFGQTGNGTSQLREESLSISADGQLIVFQSNANDLVPNDRNRANNSNSTLSDVFLFNRATGATSLVSVNAAGTSSGNENSFNAKISEDGRYILFESEAGDLTSEGIITGGGHPDIFLRDLQTGTTTLISKSLSGTTGGNAQSHDANISADGRYVVFWSGASNLVAGDTNGVSDIFIRDLLMSTTTLVSHVVGDTAAGANDNSFDPRISDDGRFVAFVSEASNLVSNDGTNIEDIFVWDSSTGAIELISVDSNEVNQSNAHNSLSVGRAFSADGRYVLFETNATNLVPENGNFEGRNVYRRDRQLGTTVAVTISENGLLATGGTAATMTPDGRYVAFVSGEGDLISGVTDTNGGSDVFLRDMQTGITELVSRNALNTGTGNRGSGVAQYPLDFSAGSLVLSDGARFVAFTSEASNLVVGQSDPNDARTEAFGTHRRDVFVRDRLTGTTNLISENLSGSATGENGSFTPAMSADGSVVAFESLANDLVVESDPLGKLDVFVRDVATGNTELASRRTFFFPDWRLADAGGGLDSATPDGRFVSFTSGNQVFVLDRLTESVDQISHRADGIPDIGNGSRLSADGRFVVFNSSANLASVGPAGSGNQIWLHDRETDETRLVSVTPAGLAAGGNEWTSTIVFTPDGRHVAWTSASQGLVDNFVDGNGTGFTFGIHDIFIRDLHTGVTRLVSHIPGSANQSGNAASHIPIFSADGSQLIFTSRATNLVAGITDTASSDDLFAFDVETGAIELISINTAGTATGNRGSTDAVVSANGRYVAFQTTAGDLGFGGFTGGFVVYVRDLEANTTTLVSINAAGTASGNANSYSPSISADGRYVAFTSEANNLVAGDTGRTDIFVRDLIDGITTRVSVTPSGDTLNWHSSNPEISPDGRRVSFYSEAGDLVANYVDLNGGFGADDLYVRDLATGVTDLVSVNDAGTGSGNAAASSANTRLRIFTDDGETLFFNGNPSDLVAGDRNSVIDVFAYSFEGAGQIRGTLFHDADRDGTQDAGEGPLPYWTVYVDADEDGLFDDGERSVRTDLNGNYALNGLAAGTYRVALELQNGFSRTVPAAPGFYSVTLVTATSVVTDRTFAAAVAQIDLQVTGVAGPTTLAAGRPFDVSWVVRNLGESPIVGDWQDAVYLSRDTVLDAGDTLVGTVPHTGGLTNAANYSASLTVNAAAELQGTLYVLVQTDRRRQVPTDLNRANNVALGAAIQVTLPQLIPETPFNDAFTAPNQDLYFQFTVAPGQSLILSLDNAAASGSTELYLRRGQLPTPWEYDFASRISSQPDQQLFVPVTQGGTYYVLARSRAGAAATSAFTLTAALPGLTVENVSTNVGGNTGRVTIKVEGGGFTPSTIVSLVSGGTSLDATFVDVRSPSLLYATFDLAGRAVGTYDVKVRDGANSNSSSGAFQVVEGGAGDIDVDIQLIVPEVARNNAGIALGVDTRPRIVVTYENKGNVDVAAPIFQLTTDYGELDVQQHTVIDENGALTFLGIGADGPAGVLRPGDKGKIEARLTLPLLVARTSATITLGSSSTYGVGDEPQGITINWGERKAEARPDFVGTDAWDPIWANFVSVVGSTTNDLQTVLSDTATYLGRLSVDLTEISDLNTLFGFELQQADALLPVPILATENDASFPTPGLQLGLGRAFLQPISGRYRLGTLGRGWVHGWEVAASADTFGNVRVDAAGGNRFFSKLHDGTYLSSQGDTGALTFTGGVYRLRELDGTTTMFRADGKIDFVQEPHGTKVTAGYDAQGQLVSLSHSTGPSLTIAYNAQSRIATVTDPAGRVDTYTYDVSGQHLISVTNEGGTKEYTYVTGEGAAREHALASIEDADGTHLLFTYDSRGRLSELQRDGGAESTTFEYGSAGEVTVTDASDAKTLLLFDQNGQLRQVRDPLGRRSSFNYDGAGDLVVYVSPTGLQWNYDRDARRNVIRTLDPLGHEMRMTYDGSFNGLASLTDARGNTTHYGYNAVGDLRSITYANASQETFDYDPLGNLSESINRRGTAIEYQYDARGLLTQKTFADGSQTDFVYDTRGNLKTATDSAGVTAFDYDSADRLTMITYPGGRFLEFTYDAGGRRTKSVDQDGFTMNYNYEAAGRLLDLRDGTNALIVGYTYDTVGRLDRKELGNGTFTTYDYDAAGQLLSLVNQAPGGAVNSSFQYTYDAEGRRTSVTTGDGTTTYDYDAIGQLTKVVLPAGRTIEYVYDAAGNRVSVTDGGATTQYLTNNLNQYVQVGTTAYSYDADGNLVAKTNGTTSTAFTFDDENRLVGSTGPDGIWSYEIDALGLRSAATHDGIRTDYLIDPVSLGDVVAEYSAGGLIAHYTHGLGLVSRTASNGSTAYYDFDATGNTSGLTNAAGSYVNRYTYLPFGETTVLAAAVSNAFTFVGEFGVMKAGGGLDFMRARYYDAAIGGFTSDDPIGFSGGDSNVRRYVGNNTLSNIDPAGLATFSISTSNGSPYTVYTGKDATDYAANHGNDLSHSDGATFPGDGGVVSLFPNEYPSYPTMLHERQHADDLTDRWIQFQVAAQAALGNPGGAQNFLEKRGYEKQLRASGMYPQDRANALHFLKWIEKNPNRGINFAAAAGEQLNKLNSTMLLVGAFDPNDIAGPNGFGSQRFVADASAFPYTIRFENAANLATAPAQEVTVTHQLDTDLDWSTVELDDVGFGSIVVDVPDGLQFYQTRVAYQNQDGSDLFVDVDISFNLETGLLTWIFRSVDPLTGFLPAGVFDGFLPVNDETHRGEGFVRYLVRSAASLVTGTTIDQQASIIFDVNTPIETNIFTNTIDAGTPTSRVTALPPTQISTTFPVAWSGTDDADGTPGSGISSFDIFVSIDAAAPVLWLNDVTTLQADYSGEVGRTYGFYSVAVDAVGHREAAPLVNDTTTGVSTHRWQNAINRLDVDNNGFVVPLDVLIIINYLNSSGSGPLPTNPSLDQLPPPYLDVNGDDIVAPIDVLLIINFLNGVNSSGEGEFSPLVSAELLANQQATDAIMSTDLCFEDPFVRRIRRQAPRHH